MTEKHVKKQVKVDNWGMFFLQRLQQHFARNEFCDITLKFSNNETIKAHRLVLDVCTEYFQMLEKQGLVVDNVICMPEDMPADSVIPVVNFMYTGRLEFQSDIQKRLYSTAQKMKMTVLTKLLDAQSLNSQQTKASELRTPVMRNSQKKMLPSNIQVKKVMPRLIDPSLPKTLPGKKLPIWTRRSSPYAAAHSSNSYLDFDRPIRIITPTVDEIPRPTRFEWPDDDDEDRSPNMLATTFEDISYESKPLMQLKETFKPSPVTARTPTAAATQRERTATFEEVLRTGAVMKRPAPCLMTNDNAKKSKSLDLQAVKDYVRETQLRKNMVKNEDSDEDVDNDLAMVDHDYDDDDDDDRVPINPSTTPHKSILKTQSSHEEDMANTSAKKVRFSLDPTSVEEKENATKVAALPTRAMANQSSGSSTTSVSNHAKIITEVLKKYPHLVKNNKNIRLKIMQRGGSSSLQVGLSTEKDGGGRQQLKSKVSYVVLKSDPSGAKGKPSLGIKHGSMVEQLSSLEEHTKPISGAENVKGPWLCHTCGTNEEPINFETYFAYRHHLQDVHNEKIDARICEHCGHRASKRNLLLYHMYTKHGVVPPRNCQFPKCDQCDYVALSESLLIKHRNNHTNSKDYLCKVCNASFKSHGALQGHLQTNLHSDPYKKNQYECPVCQKPFLRNINLKAHIRVSHNEMAKNIVVDDELDVEDGMEDELMENGEGQVMEVPVIDMLNQNSSGMTILAEAPVSLEPSSEAEGFGHVATGIAASLGLADGQQTVILLDENQEYIIHTTEIGEEYGDDQLVQEVHEYIVPEMAADGEVGFQDEAEMEYSEEQPIHGSGEVLMVLTDHCYAEEVVSKDAVDDTVDNSHGEDFNEEQGLSSYELPDKGLPSTEGSNQAPAKAVIQHIAKPMADLLDDWDEELSQEVEESPEVGMTGKQEALPTRGDIPEELFKNRDTSLPVEESSEIPEVFSAQSKLLPDAEMSEISEDLFKETEGLILSEGHGESTMLLEDNSQNINTQLESGTSSFEIEGTVTSASNQDDTFLTKQNDGLSMELELDSFPNGTGENDTFVGNSELGGSAADTLRDNTLSSPTEIEGSKTLTQEAENSVSFKQETEHCSESLPERTNENTPFPAPPDQISQFPQETEQMPSFTQEMERDRSTYQDTPFGADESSFVTNADDGRPAAFLEAHNESTLAQTNNGADCPETNPGTTPLIIIENTAIPVEQMLDTSELENNDEPIEKKSKQDTDLDSLETITE